MRRRELVAGSVVATLLLIGVLFLGPPDTRAVEGPPPPPAGSDDAVLDRPAVRKPDDPHRTGPPRLSETVRPPANAVAPGLDGASTGLIAVRVADARGAPRAGTPVELWDGDPTQGGIRRGVPVRADAAGSASLPWPADRALKRAFIVPAMLLAEPHAAPVARGAAEATFLAVPDAGDVEISFVDEGGAPYRGVADAVVLLAEHDPPADAVLRDRARAEASGGVARFSGVETGTLLLIEGRLRDRSLRTAPLLTEGPSTDGAIVRAALRVLPRSSASARVRAADPALGPPRAGAPAAAENEASLVLRPEPSDAVPAWPLVLEIVFASAAPVATVSARVDEKGVARVALPAGRWRPKLRLWRAAPDGWTTTDVASESPAFDARAGASDDRALKVDAAAIAAAAAELATY
jgi:hypothetical protein